MYLMNNKNNNKNSSKSMQLISICNLCPSPPTPPTVNTHTLRNVFNQASETVMGKTVETVIIEAILLCNLTARFLPRITQLIN